MKRLAALLSCLLLLSPASAFASIAYDSGSTGTITSGNTNTTFSDTATGSNLDMEICIAQQNDASANRISASNVTFNGVAASLVHSVTDSGGDTVYAFEIVGPASGAHTVSVTRTGTTNSTLINVTTHTGVVQTGQPDAFGTSNGTGSPLNTNLSSIANNAWSFLCTYDSNGGTISASTNSTGRQAVTTYSQMFDSNVAITPAGSFTMTVTRSPTGGTNPFLGVTFSVAPAGGLVTQTYDASNWWPFFTL
jgi:hypothetical protein